jgi:hypothetical protein
VESIVVFLRAIDKGKQAIDESTEIGWRYLAHRPILIFHQIDRKREEIDWFMMYRQMSPLFVCRTCVCIQAWKQNVQHLLLSTLSALSSSHRHRHQRPLFFFAELFSVFRMS